MKSQIPSTKSQINSNELIYKGFEVRHFGFDWKLEIGNSTKWHMLFPKKVKHRKWHRHAGSVRANATRTHRVNFGEWGLKAMTHGYATSRQIESARRTISRYLHKGGKMWIRVFPDKPITIKGSEVPMGSGK